MTKLSVNVNKIALLRNARSGGTPDLARLGAAALEAGADGLTVHPRPDQRHIRHDDVIPLARLCSSYGREYNIEGNPAHNLLDECQRARPTQATLVPDAPDASTSDHGWDLLALDEKGHQALATAIASLKTWGCRVSLFVDPVPELMPVARDLGADRVELYTGPYAAAAAGPDATRLLARHAEAASAARRAGLGVNAGHDLTADNLEAFLSRVSPDEVSIGHALISDALTMGLSAAVALYRSVMARADAARSLQP